MLLFVFLRYSRYALVEGLNILLFIILGLWFNMALYLVMVFYQNLWLFA